MTWSFQLDQDFYACERGNTWLEQQGTGNHVAWFKLDDGHFLEVAVEPANYPGFKVAVVAETEAGLARHINEKCQGWLVRKCNTEGVKSENGCVAGEGAGDNDQPDEEDSCPNCGGTFDPAGSAPT